MLKKLLLALSIGWLIIPSAALAQATIPEFNPLCWHKKDCCDVRAGVLGKTSCDQLTPEQQDGWMENEAPCTGKDWGKCLPVGQTITEISFGGQRQFRNLGELIFVIYRYAITIAGILAAVVIIVAGFQWTTSGGNSEAITSAKKRIGGAIMGAFLAYMSYFILTAINPAMVSLRLPNVWMIRPQAMTPQFCSQAPSSTAFAFAASTAEQDKTLSAINASAMFFDLTYSGAPKMPSSDSNLNKAWTNETFSCGTRFYIKDGGKNTCFGDVCKPAGDYARTCGQDPTSQNAKHSYECITANIFGVVSNSSGGNSQTASFVTGGHGWANPPLRNSAISNFLLLNICANGNKLFGIASTGETVDIQKNSIGTVEITDLPSGTAQKYLVSVTNADLQTAEDNCSVSSQMKGFVLDLGFNSLPDMAFTQLHLLSGDTPFSLLREQHFIGKDGVDLGDNYFFEKYGIQIPSRYFFSTNDLKKGVNLNIDAVSITSFAGDRDADSPNHIKVYGYLIGK